MFLLHWRRVAVAALRSNRSNPDFAVARYGTNGAPDASFGSGGKLTIDFFGSFDGAENVAVQPDGKIVVGGFARKRLAHQLRARADLAVEAMMAHVLHLQQTYRRTLSGVRATIGAILRAVTAEHTLALRAATRAASPRQSLAEVRAMYVPSEPHQHGTEPGGQKRE